MTTHLARFADLADAVRHLAPAKSEKTDHADRFDLGAVVAAGSAYRVVDQDGRHLSGFVVQPFGRVLWITVAAGRAGLPLCPGIDEHAVDLARRFGFGRLMFRTERAGLVARARRLGWSLARQDGRSYYMNKDIT